MFYALHFLTGEGPGETAGRRWLDIDSEAQPLGRMVIAIQLDGRRLKTDRPREMPIHPTLAAVLAEWRMEGFERWFGRPPRPTDYIVPETSRQHWRKGQHRVVKSSLRRLHRDLEALGLRSRRQHDARRTLITIGRSDGANPDVLRSCTHGDKGDVFDAYTSWPWDVKCREISKIRISRKGRSNVVPLRRTGTSGEDTESSQEHNPEHSGPEGSAESPMIDGLSAMDAMSIVRRAEGEGRAGLPLVWRTTPPGPPCKAPPVRDPRTGYPVNGRCRVHGGTLRGPKTPEGRARANLNLRRGNQPGPGEVRRSEVDEQ